MYYDLDSREMDLTLDQHYADWPYWMDEMYEDDLADANAELAELDALPGEIYELA